MKRARIIALFLMIAMALFAVNAEGIREQGADETLVRVLSISKGDDGVYRIDALKEDGSEVVYLAGEDCESSYPLEMIKADDYLMVTGNGIMTMSLPPQSPAVSIRYVTPAVINGLISADFSTPRQYPGLILNITEINSDDMVSRFSYAYGYLSGKGLEANSLYPHAGYFARGVIDAGKADEAEPLITTEDMNAAIQEYIAQYMQQGVITDHGDVYATMDELMALEAPVDLVDRFAYAYGYFSYLNLLYNGLEVYSDEFAYGALAAFYGATSPYTVDEMNAIVEEYAAQLQAEYEAWLAELSASNLEKAEAYLNDNAAREGVITTDSGLQLEFTYDDTTESATPASDSLVVVDYTLTLMDGTVMDQGEGVEFSLSNLIPGFSEAVMNMTVGDSVRAYVHPSLGYGENGTPTIEPNSLLIFDITLDEIK